MKYLNISQSRYTGISHKKLNAYDLAGKDTGIDDFIAYYPYEIISIHRYNKITKKGFANTIHFYDRENNVTLAMTHIDEIPKSFYVGKKFNIGDVMYKEGRVGRATGNHIHLEIGKGKQVKKILKNGEYQLSSFINIEDYFFVDDSIIIKETKGIKFEHRNEEYTNMNSGFKKFYWQGQLIYFYKQSANEEITLINSPYKDLRNIRDFVENEKYKQGLDITCAVNASYFIFDGKERGQILGRTQGINTDERPDKDGYLDLVITPENKLVSGDFDSWEWLKPYAKLGVSYACCVLKDGKDIAEYSSAIGKEKLTKKYTQTLLMKDKEGLFSFAVVRGLMNGADCREFAKEHGMTDCYMLDSGGSSQMLTKNDEGYITGRALPNVLVFYKLPKSEETINEPTKENTIIKPIGKLTVQRIGLNIRNLLLFDRRKPIGQRVGFLRKGESVEIIDFIPNLQPDGFQWVKVKWGKGEAYAQYDSTCYTVEIYK